MSRFARIRPLCWAALLLAAGAAAYAADPEHGHALYATRCAFCHGPAGKGDGPAGAALKPPPTDFTSAAFWKTTPADTIHSTIENGKPGTAMMGFKSSLRAEDIDDLVAYLKGLRPAR
jgi:high-affinity iron transporter